jgi:hypothetical protein
VSPTGNGECGSRYPDLGFWTFSFGSWILDSIRSFGTMPLTRHTTASPVAIQADAEKLVRFVSLYCKACHGCEDKNVFAFHYGKIPVVINHGPSLCRSCERLLRHAIVLRALCPLDPKPRCRKCPKNCYRPRYREQMERVMKYAGPRSFFKR